MDIIHTIGRRKRAIARVYLSSGSGDIKINDRDYKEYFPTLPLQYMVQQAFEVSNTTGTFDVKANIVGGGITGQAQALRLAISRALVKNDAEVKPMLKAKELLTRDPRMVERKKPGQKKARKRFQFSKR